MVTLLGTLICLLSFIIVLFLLKFFHKFWWVPMRVNHVMSSQGITGPRYVFIHGNSKEISRMSKESMRLPMEISHDIFPRIQPHINSWFHVYGKNFVFWHGPRAQVVVTEPYVLKEIMSDTDISMRRQDVGPFFKKVIGDGLISSQGKKWAKQRKIATHVFHGQRLKNMVPMMIECVDMMLKRWQNIGIKEMNVYEEFGVMTSEVISRTAFGSTYEDGNQVFQKLRALLQLTAKHSYDIRLPGFGIIFKDKDDRESDKLQAGIQDVIMQMIRNREKMTISRDENNSDTDYLGLLLKAHYDLDNDKDYKLSIQDIIDDCKSFYSAGQRTTSLLLSWVILLLGVHNEWQEKARDEVQQVFGKQNPSLDGITKLKTMGMIINETLRLYPPALNIVRKVCKKTKVGNLVLPANINLCIPVLALHQDPKIWGKDAHFFKPERFSEGIAKATNNNPAAFLPFGYGPRNCVGSSFALIEAKIALTMILQRYKFTRSPNYVHAPVQLVTLRPKFGVQIMFEAL